MNINVYIEEDLSAAIDQLAKSLGKKRNAIIREALREWVEHHRIAQWPKSVLEFKGDASFSGFETERKQLKNPKKDPFA